MGSHVGLVGEVQEGGVRKPEGGFVLIGTELCVAAFYCYRAGQIGLRDLRTFWALWELQARRSAAAQKRAPRFRLEELHRLVGGVGGEHIRASLRALRQVGLVRVFSREQLGLAESVSELKLDQGALAALLDSVPNRRRRVPVPRRLLRFLAGGGTKALQATLLGHLIRCLFYRKGACHPEGACSASWVAELFGVSSRRAKEARAKLLELGILHRLEAPHWYEQRYGARIAINLKWGRADNRTPQKFSTTKSSPRRAFPTTESSPPESNKELPNGTKNQEPATPGPRTVSGVSKPNLRNIKAEDLVEPPRTLELFRQAVQLGLLSKSPAERLRFFGLAEHARTYATRNAPGYFRRLIHDPQYEITQADEDRARARLREFDQGESKRCAGPGDAPSVLLAKELSGLFAMPGVERSEAWIQNRKAQLRRQAEELLRREEPKEFRLVSALCR